MFLALLLLWIIFNGKVTLEIVIFGIVLSLLITIFTKKLLYVEPEEKSKHIFRNGFLFLQYILILIVEIIKANMSVFAIIFKKNLDFEPALVSFKTDIKSKKLRVLLADSITLTPGTITVDLKDDGTYTVHCLDKSLGNGLNSSIFVEMIKKMEA